MKVGDANMALMPAPGLPAIAPCGGGDTNYFLLSPTPRIYAQSAVYAVRSGQAKRRDDEFGVQAFSVSAKRPFFADYVAASNATRASVRNRRECARHKPMAAGTDAGGADPAGTMRKPGGFDAANVLASTDAETP